MVVDWAHPDFADPCFQIEHVEEATRCRQDGCLRIASILVDYTMRRGGWTYDYGCGYCDEHVPSRVRERL